jgi:intracellular septation protein A
MRLAEIARHAGRNLLEATVVPLILFYLALWSVGVWGALWVALAWTWGAIARRSLRGRRVPGILVLGAVGLTVRTALALASGSVFVYFLQPTLSAVAIGGAFCGSVLLGRPLVCRLAADFCPMTPAVQARPAVRRLCNRLSLLWGAMNLLNAGIALWLLSTQSIGTFMVTKTIVSTSMTGIATVISITAAIRVGRAEGLFGHRDAPLVPAPLPAPAFALAAA